MRKLYIMRGLPGSGKTTMARKLAGAEGVICSADDYFMKQGVYEFNPTLLVMAHEHCRNEARDAMKGDAPVVIIDNTNVQHWEYEPYIKMAKNYGYKVEVVMVGNLKDIELYTQRNSHNVPYEAIKRMADRFER